MRRILLATGAAVALLTGAGSASAYPLGDVYDYPYCLQGSDWGYPGLCHFWTYEQCAATASGTFSYCGINPRFAFSYQPRRY
jgi:Protein of unknown function (DUF3551)